MKSCQSLFVTSIKGDRLLKPMWKIVPLVQLVLDTLKGVERSSCLEMGCADNAQYIAAKDLG